MRRSAGSRVVRAVAVAAICLALATLAVWVLEEWVGVGNAAIVYVVAVAATAVLGGTPGAVGASIGAFLLYDFFFVEPRYTFTIRDPEEWLNGLLLVFVAVLVGQLTAILRRQTEAAKEREEEALAMFRVSRALATRTSTVDAARLVVDGVVRETVATRAWIEIVDPAGLDRILVDTDAETPRPSPASIYVLRRTEGDAPAEWTRVHVATRPSAQGTVADTGTELHKVGMDAGGRRVGALWVVVPKAAGWPRETDTRLLAAVADQVAQALEADRLSAEARTAAIARESDRAKTALLESVSHDLRTPLAAIRAAAGTLMDRTVELGPEDRYLAAETIDQDADRLNRIVTNLLDLSRVEAGALKPELDGYDLDDLVESALNRARPRLGSRPVALALGSPPPVRVDATFVDQILENLLANIIRYAGADAPIAISAAVTPDGRFVRLTVEDGGPGVPEDALPLLFDKFYRVSNRGQAARGGSGVGLAVVRGFADAMGGEATARRSGLGGLAVDILLPVAVSDDVTAVEPAPS